MVSDLVKKIGTIIVAGTFVANVAAQDLKYSFANNNIKANAHIIKVNDEWKLTESKVKVHANIGDIKSWFKDKPIDKTIKISPELQPVLKTLAIMYKHNSENSKNNNMYDMYLTSDGSLVEKVEIKNPCLKKVTNSIKSFLGQDVDQLKLGENQSYVRLSDTYLEQFKNFIYEHFGNGDYRIDKSDLENAIKGTKYIAGNVSPEYKF